ncbi:hypothetical protein P6709_10115 [Jeotgalibacillus sp. ET6]|uniref:hypothetical protein n=1 Tax=Jeotgalibacillus sp. ET6 TaxID=3037260 RepID=UPI0024182904|nr:hypothetical protein [Jeotgalibacillus sp. ET6]MDG5472107.1 hypothetical protein [Jeotgalibacillus sp. ET6]
MRWIKLICLITAISLLGGCSILNNYSEDQYEEAETMAVDYLNKNYEEIETIEIDSVEDSPMGGIFVQGRANTIGFNISISSDSQGELSFSSIGEEEGFPKSKEECKDVICK